MSIIGNGYLASNKLEISTANKEIVPVKPENWTRGYRLYKFAFINEQSCAVIINNKTTVFLKAGQGFEIDLGDFPIDSFIIVESGISYNWIGMY